MSEEVFGLDHRVGHRPQATKHHGGISMRFNTSNNSMILQDFDF
jgi:hypothetical protein